jgi:hypothetical protein
VATTVAPSATATKTRTPVTSQSPTATRTPQVEGA